MIEISGAQIARFAEDGFVIVDRILDDAQVAAALAASDRVQRGECTHDRRPTGLRKPLAHFGTGASIRWYLNARMVDGELWRLTTDAALGGAAATLLGTSALSLVEDQLLDKPTPGLPCNFHQDFGYWLFSTSTQMISAWIALVDMTLDMGPLELIPGSHRWAYLSNPRELIAGSEDSWFEAVDHGRPADAPADRVQACVPAGGGVFFHSLTFHGSARNQSGARRRALSVHWAGGDCRVNRAKLSEYTYPYLFAGLKHGSPIVNDYMPLVYSAGAERRGLR